VSYVLKKNKPVFLLSSPHHDSGFCSVSGKPAIIECYNNTKGAVDMLHQMYARYTIQCSGAAGLGGRACLRVPENADAVFQW
jgi:hypothetical protein